MGAILELTRTCFTDALILRDLVGDGLQGGGMRRQISADVAAMVREAREQGISPASIDLVKYAMVSVIDEFAQAGPLGAAWTEQPLQAELLGDVNAGQGFFTHLEALLSARKLDETGLDVLQIYATCLFLGFRGKYAARVDATGFEALRHRVDEKLGDRLVSAPLPAPRRLRRVAVRPLPTWIWWVPGVCGSFTLALWTSLRFDLGRQVARLWAFLGQAQS